MIAQKVSFSFFANIIHMALGYVSLFFVARYMGPAALGLIAFAESYIGVFSPISEFGYAWAHVKRVSEGRDLGVCNGTYFSIKIVLTVVMIMVILVTVFVTKVIHPGAFVSREHELVLYIMLAVAFMAAFSRVITVTFQARKETAKQIIPWMTEKVVLVALKVIVAVAGLGVILLASASFVSAVVGLVFLLYLFRKYPIKKPTREYIKSYTIFSLPIMFIGILPVLAQNVDKIMIQFFFTSTDVGYYAAVQRVSFVIEYIGVASVTLLFPTISAYHSRNDRVSIRNLSLQAERYLSIILFPFVMVILVFSVPISRFLLGTEFVVAAPILVVLAVVWLIHTTSQPYAQQLGGTDNVKRAAKIGSLTFVIDVALNFIFIPDRLFGVKMLGLRGFGAAISTLISTTIGVILYRFAAYRLTASKPNVRILISLLVSVTVGLLLYVITLKMNFITWYAFLSLCVGGLMVYGALLVLTGELTRDDVALFKKMLSPMAMREYVVGELRSGFIDTNS